MGEERGWEEVEGEEGEQEEIVGDWGGGGGEGHWEVVGEEEND